jgi:hypothetical protein
MGRNINSVDQSRCRRAPFVPLLHPATPIESAPPETPNCHTNQILAAIDPLDHIVEGAEEIAAVRGQSVKRTRYLLERNQIDADKVGRKWITNVRRALRPRKSGSARWAMSPSFGRSRLWRMSARVAIRHSGIRNRSPPLPANRAPCAPAPLRLGQGLRLLRQAHRASRKQLTEQDGRRTPHARSLRSSCWTMANCSFKRAF